MRAGYTTPHTMRRGVEHYKEYLRQNGREPIAAASHDEALTLAKKVLDRIFGGNIPLPDTTPEIEACDRALNRPPFRLSATHFGRRHVRRALSSVKQNRGQIADFGRALRLSNRARRFG